jgi:hypothetical protein
MSYVVVAGENTYTIDDVAKTSNTVTIAQKHETVVSTFAF